MTHDPAHASMRLTHLMAFHHFAIIYPLDEQLGGEQLEEHSRWGRSTGLPDAKQVQQCPREASISRTPADVLFMCHQGQLGTNADKWSG